MLATDEVTFMCKSNIEDIINFTGGWEKENDYFSNIRPNICLSLVLISTSLHGVGIPSKPKDTRNYFSIRGTLYFLM
jgi:hypothetical protein